MNNIKPLLTDTGRGLTIKYRDKYLYSRFNPEKNVDRLIDNINWQPSTIYLIPSPLLGYGLKKIKSLLPDDSILLLIETDKNLYNIYTQYDLNLITNGFDLIHLLSKLDFSKFKKCEMLKLNGGFDINRDLYNRFYRVLLNYLQNFWRNRLTLSKMGQLWIKNTLQNLDSITDSHKLSELKTEKPVVILGAGESAETSINIIKKYRQSIFVLCVDTALQILLEVDLKPDAVLALEAQYYNLPDFYGAKNRHIDLIYDLTSYPAVMRNLKGKKYFTITEFSNSSLISKVKDNYSIDSVPPMGSVGITAIFTALKITNNNVFTTGLDFSYKLGKTHSKGTPYHKTSLINWSRTNPGDTFGACLKRPLIQVKNKIGIFENSDKILYEYSLQAKELLFNYNRVFDLSSRGMDLGIPIIDKKQFHELINIENIVTKTEKVPKNNIDVNLSINELKHLNKGISTLRNLIDNKVELDEALTILKDIDYFFDHYPEQHPLSLLTKENSKRYYYTLMRYKRILTGSMK